MQYFSRAILLDYDYDYAYYKRGIAKEKVGLLYCTDFQKGCELGNKDACKLYDEECASEIELDTLQQP